MCRQNLRYTYLYLKSVLSRKQNKSADKIYVTGICMRNPLCTVWPRDALGPLRRIRNGKTSFCFTMCGKDKKKTENFHFFSTMIF